MLAQVTYIQKFIMADSEDEFMPIFVAASAAFVANNPKHLPAGRPPAGSIKYIGRCPVDTRPMPHDVPR